LQKRFLPITILTGTLFLVALGAYLVPAGTPEEPVRVLLANKGGNVIFTHQTHAAMEGRTCAQCHHTSGDDPAPPACSDCHVKKFDDAFALAHQDAIDESQCVACHHPGASIVNFSHGDHAEEYAAGDCQTCHHDASIEPEPQKCSSCHGKRDDILSLKEANHERCASCHEDIYAQGIKGCHTCHTREMAKTATPDPQPCADCHTEPVDQLVPTTTAAFHAKCMGCHEETKSGPYGDDACFKCHMK
jgi:hypothetical protein